MTTTPVSGYRWNSGTRPLPFDASKFPRQGVIGEVKPHNTAGIAAGIAQLRTRPGITRRTPQLVTYRQVPGQPTRYEVLAADSTQLKGVVSGRRASVSTWYTLGVIEAARAAQPIPLWQCPARLGSLLEPRIRRRYADRVGAALDMRSAFQTGADIVHELAEFFTELAAELEAETEGY